MAIVKMKRLRLIGLKADRDELLQLLQHMGCVEIDEPAEQPSDPDWGALARPDTDALAAAREIHAGVESALKALKKYSPKQKGGLLTPRPVLTESEFFDGTAYTQARETAGRLVALDSEISALYAEQNKLKAQKLSLAPWLDLDIPLETTSTQKVTVIFGAVAASADLDALEGALQAETGLAELIRAGKDRELQYFVFLCHKSAEAACQEILKQYGFSRAALRGWTGTAVENDKQLDAQLAENAKRLEATIEEMGGYADQKDALERCLDRTAQEIAREEARCRLLDTNAAFFLEGWVPAPELPALEKALGGRACAWETEDPAPEEYPQVPIKLKNNKLTAPLNMVTSMYVLPAYDGTDPNPLMAPFFIAFFGIMMADMGYGILMAAMGLFVLLKMRPREGMRNFAGLILLCGISTFIVGAMTGGFFGDFVPQLIKIFDPSSDFVWFWPPLFTPLDNTLEILIGSLVLGLIQVITGMAISVVRKFKAGEAADAIWDEITWWIILAGIGLAVLGIASVSGVPVVLVVGLLMLVYGSTRKAKGFGKVTALIGAIYNGATGFFSDILSYARLMALMLAGSVIAQVFNTLGSVFGNVVVFVIIALIGNLLNLALNLLGCYVHDLRLQCLEYFGRFYKEGGKPFRPLTIQTKYVDILKEEQ